MDELQYRGAAHTRDAAEDRVGRLLKAGASESELQSALVALEIAQENMKYLMETASEDDRRRISVALAETELRPV